MKRRMKRSTVVLLSGAMVLAGCGQSNSSAWTINEETVNNAVALNSRIISHSSDLIVRLEGEGIVFNSSLNKDAILIRDIAKELPENTETSSYLTYQQIKAVSIDDYSVDVVSSGKALEITIPSSLKNASYGAIIAPYANDKGVMAYADFSGYESIIKASEGNFERIGSDSVDGYDWSHTFVYKYEGLTLSEGFSEKNVSLLGAFEGWVVKDLHVDEDGVIVLEACGYGGEGSGAVVFDNETFVEDRGGAFSYRVLFSDAILLDDSVKFDEGNKTFSFDVKLVDCEIKKDFSLKDVTLIEGFVVKQADYVAETEVVSIVLDAAEFESLTEIVEALSQTSIAIGGEFDKEVAFDFQQPEVFAIASNEDGKVTIDLHSFDGELSLQKSDITIDAEFLADEDEEELLPLEEATFEKIGKGYRLTWDKDLQCALFGSVLLATVSVSYANGNTFALEDVCIDFGFDYYQVNAVQNEALKRLAFAYVTPTSLEEMDETYVEYVHDSTLETASTAIGAVNAVVQIGFTILSVIFPMAEAGAGKGAIGGVIGFLLAAMGLSAVAAALDPTAATLQEILSIVTGINETVNRMNKTLSEVSYKTDMVLLRQRLNADENKLIELRARQREFQAKEAEVKQYEKRLATVANRYLSSIIDGNSNKKSKTYNAPTDYDVVIVEGKDAKGKVERTSTVLIDDDSFEETYDAGTIVSSYAFSFGNNAGMKNTFKNALVEYKKAKSFNNEVVEAMISDIEAAIKSDAITFDTNGWNHSAVPDVSDDEKAKAVAKDVYRALYLYAERESLYSIDGEEYVLAAVDYMQRFSGTGTYSSRAADITIEMLKLTYGFQSECINKIHQYRINVADRLLKVYNLACTVCATDPDISSFGDLKAAYLASTKYLNDNKMIHKASEERVIAKSKIPVPRLYTLDYCYVSDCWVRGGQLMTAFKVSSDKNGDNGYRSFNIEDASGEILSELSSNTSNVTPIKQVKPYLFGIEDMRVLSIRRQMNHPNLSNFEYLNNYLAFFQVYMSLNNDLNKLDFTGRTDATKAVTARKRFVYSYTGFTELGTHTEGDFAAYCCRSFSKEHGKNPSYFSLNQVINGFPADSKRELKYYRGWGLKGDFSDIENVMNVQGTGYMNRFVNYNEDHGYWINPENWGFGEFNSVDKDHGKPDGYESIEFYYCLIKMY